MSFDLIDIKKKSDIVFCFNKEKDLIYLLLFYFSGLVIGSFGFQLIKNDFLIKSLKSILNLQSEELFSLFISNFAIYISLFSVAMLLGMCLIGYPVLNIIPLLLGCSIGIKVTYYYITFGEKGIGYSLLLVIPQAAAFITVLIYTIITSANLSKYILNVIFQCILLYVLLRPHSVKIAYQHVRYSKQ